MEKQKQAKNKEQILQGKVVSDKMDKTVVVLVERVRTHRKYQKKYTVSRRFKVHDPKNQFKTGDEVEFVQCRPLSKDKKWRVLYK